MKNFFKVSFFALLFVVTSSASASTKGTNHGNNPPENNNDSTSTNIKSNIVIFKMISTPAVPQENSNGSLKKAGKVARTSYSHTTIEKILYTKKGI